MSVGFVEAGDVVRQIEAAAPSTLPGGARLFALAHRRGHDLMLVLPVGMTAQVQGVRFTGAARVANGQSALLRDAAGAERWLRYRASGEPLAAREAGVTRCTICHGTVGRDERMSVCTSCHAASCPACAAARRCLRCTHALGGSS